MKTSRTGWSAGLKQLGPTRGGPEIPFLRNPYSKGKTPLAVRIACSKGRRKVTITLPKVNLP